MESKSVIRNFIWRLAERFGAHGVTFVVSIVLARILGPEVYGELALITVFTTILQVFVDSGLGVALIQKKEADELDFSSVFIFNIGVCVLLYVIIFLFAPLIAIFYRMPHLTSEVRVLGLIIIISGIKNIQQAYVARNMLFKRFFFSTLGGTLGAAVIGIWLALNGFGVWALIAQFLFNASIDTLILWITVKWRPQFKFSFMRLKGLLAFGIRILGVSLLNTTYNEIRALAIGKVYTKEDLAFYNKGNQFPQLIATNVDTSIDSILLPTMSQKQDDVDTVRRYTRLSIKVGTYIMMPIMIGLAVCADHVIEILLGKQWLPCVPFMIIFCLSFCFYPIFTTNYNAYKALGRSDIYFRVTVVSKIIGFVILLCTMWFGVKWIAYGLLASSLINQIICARPNSKLLGYSYREQISDIYPNIIVSLLMGIVVWGIGKISFHIGIVLCIQILVGGLSYVALSFVLKNESFYFIIRKIGLKNKRF